ncbi:MAG: hypothetical protein NTV34_18100 [Proteobacteria bacterium]|nr:hypothetical protein [Pseudomonadota bacterium]
MQYHVTPATLLIVMMVFVSCSCNQSATTRNASAKVSAPPLPGTTPTVTPATDAQPLVPTAPTFNDASIGAFGDLTTFTVSGLSDPGTTVKLFNSTVCAGDVVTSVPAQTFLSGIPLDVATAQRTVMSALAVTSEGRSSSCSNRSASYTKSGWIWRSGSKEAPWTGSFGTKGIASPSNLPPGRSAPASWIVQDKLWYFGGNVGGGWGNGNDLWTYNPSTSEWTWISGPTAGTGGSYGTLGIADPANLPPQRAAAAAFATDSALWVFGGYKSGGLLSDLWKFDLASQMWTWVSGSSSGNAQGDFGTKGVTAATNSPPNRYVAFSWTDQAGNFWLFGGLSRNATDVSTRRNDLWKYSPTANLWTWIAGSNVADQFGVNGTAGTAAAANSPGARYLGCSWRDSLGRLWLFGGQGYGASGVSGYLSDLWRFDPATSLWTFVTGADTVNQTGVYGTQAVAHADNQPGGRRSSNCWIDSRDRLWLFGGEGYDEAGVSVGQLSDLWYFTPSTGMWTWDRGAKTKNAFGSFGVLNLADEANAPGAKQDVVPPLVDSTGRVWLFGGYGYGATGAVAKMNDLWSIEAP